MVSNIVKYETVFRSELSSSVFLFFSIIIGNGEMVSTLADAASNAGKNNVAFLSHFILGDLEKCLDVLIESGRLPEAAFFARTYLPSQISKVLVCVCYFFLTFFS